MRPGVTDSGSSLCGDRASGCRHTPYATLLRSEAAPGSGTERAVEYAALAAKRADRQLAYEEAVVFYERAVRALVEDDPFRVEGDTEHLQVLGQALCRSHDKNKRKVALRRAHAS